MALAETAELAVKLSLGGNFVSQMGKVNRSLKTFDKESSRAYRAGQQIGTGIKRGAAIAAGGVALLASQVALGLDSLVELESQTAQTNAVIKSTGGVAGITATEVGRLAEKYESLNATIGDEVIREGQNLLLTFTNIRKKAFEPALQAALDMNTAMGKGPEGLTSTVRILGKALNDPTKGLSALSRVGITFSKEQAKRIKGLQEEGKLYEAQTLILGELEKRFGGSFLAGGSTTAGKVAKFQDAIDDLQRSLATALLPTVGNLADAFSDLLQDKDVIRATEDLGREIGKLFSKDNIKAGAKAIGDVFSLIRDAAPAIKSALGTVGTVLSTAFKAFTSLPPEVQQLLIGGLAVNKLTGGLITNIAGGIFGALKLMTVQAGVVNVNGGIVNGGGKGLPAGGPKGGGGGAAGAVGNVVKVAGVVGLAVGLGALAVEVSGLRSDEHQIGGQTVRATNNVAKRIEQTKANIAALTERAANGDQVAQRQLAEQRTVLANLLGKTSELITQSDRTKDDTVAAQNRTRDAAIETKRETNRSGGVIAATTRQGSASVVNAIYANRPIITTIVNVSATTVEKTTIVNKRYGSSGGSRNEDSDGSGTLGNGGR
jgi:hypothetical protein